GRDHARRAVEGSAPAAGDVKSSGFEFSGVRMSFSLERLLSTATTPPDPRWKQLEDRRWTCSVCKGRHAGLIEFACRRPLAWPHGEDYVPNDRVMTSTHFLSEDFCRLRGEHFFVRCVLPLPLIGYPGKTYCYGVWSMLSPADFQAYLEH